MKRKSYIEKSCNYCYDCNRNYPLDIENCPECHRKMFPVPYSPMDVKK